MKLLKVKFEIKAKLQVAVMIPPTLWPTAAWRLLAVDCAAPRAWQGLPLGVLVNVGHQSGAGQGRKPRPGLGFLPWPVTQKYDLSKPPLVTCSPTPPQTSVGDRVGGIITVTCSLQLISNFTSSSFMMKWLRHFSLEILKKTINA